MVEGVTFISWIFIENNEYPYLEDLYSLPCWHHRSKPRLVGSQTEAFIINGTNHPPEVNKVKHNLSFALQGTNYNQSAADPINYNNGTESAILGVQQDTKNGTQSQYGTSPCQQTLKPCRHDPKPGYRDPKPGGDPQEGNVEKESQPSAKSKNDNAGYGGSKENVTKRKKGKYKSRLLRIKTNTGCVSNVI